MKLHTSKQSSPVRQQIASGSLYLFQIEPLVAVYNEHLPQSPYISASSQDIGGVLILILTNPRKSLATLLYLNSRESKELDLMPTVVASCADIA
jgi:hypothetical protein